MFNTCGEYEYSSDILVMNLKSPLTHATHHGYVKACSPSSTLQFAHADQSKVF